MEVLHAEQGILKGSEETLESEKNKLSSVIGAMSSYLTIIDRDYTVTYQNLLSEELLGNFIGKKCYQAFGQGEKIYDSCPVKLAFHDAQIHRSIRKTVEPDGKITYIEYVANPTHLPDVRIFRSGITEVGCSGHSPKRLAEHVMSEFEFQRRGEKTLAAGLPCLRKDGTVFYSDITACGVIINGRECIRASSRTLPSAKRWRMGCRSPTMISRTSGPSWSSRGNWPPSANRQRVWPMN